MNRERWLATVATAALAAVGIACLLLSQRALSATYDEPQHLSVGLEWWQRGTYRTWTENPPLPRVALAAIPYFRGLRLPEHPPVSPPQRRWFDTWLVGTDVLHAGDGYEANLSRARVGTFPFFILLLFAVWILAEGRRRPLAGLLAVGLTATHPFLVGNGALATTDVAFTAMMLLAMAAGQAWIGTPTRRAAVLMGAAIAGALLAKFTALPFLAIGAAGMLTAHRLTEGTWRPGGTRLGAQVTVAALVAAVVIWSGYRFSVGAIGDLPEPGGGWLNVLPAPSERSALVRWFLSLHLPAPELFHGLWFAKRHNDVGQTAYLFGQLSPSGFRSFYLIAFLLKTPLPFLALLLAAPVLVARRIRYAGNWSWMGLGIGALGILTISAGSRVNIGFRHVMPVLPLFAVAIAGAWDTARESAAGRRRKLLSAVAALGLAGQVAILVMAHPNQLSYFNPLAGRQPAAALLNSDLDWGQGLIQLRNEVQARGITSLKVALFGTANLCGVGLPRLEPLVPGQPTTGWIAISENHYRHRSYSTLLQNPCDRQSVYPRRLIPPQPYEWLRRHQPVTVIADSIRLYYVPSPGTHETR